MQSSVLVISSSSSYDTIPAFFSLLESNGLINYCIFSHTPCMVEGSLLDKYITFEVPCTVERIKPLQYIFPTKTLQILIMSEHYSPLPGMELEGI